MRGRAPFARLLFFFVVLIGALALPAKALASPFEAKIHVLPFNYTDAIVVECNGHFGIVDSGEDNSYPDGSDQRYPLREGIIIGCGVEDKVIPYLWKIGVRPGNLDFYIGTHPHSDHIGSASQIIQMFKPSRIYTPNYDDSYITDEDHLWDNQYVYDRLIEAAHEAEGEYGAQLIQNFTYLNRSFMLGGAFIQLYNTGTDYQTTGVFDANCFSLGVKVTVDTHSAFLAGDINNYTGVEDELASLVGSVDFSRWGTMAVRVQTQRPILTRCPLCASSRPVNIPYFPPRPRSPWQTWGRATPRLTTYMLTALTPMWSRFRPRA